jgi:precorrin-6B methylase 2
MFGVLILFNIILIIYAIYGLRSGAPFLPSSNKAVKTMMLIADIKPGQIIYDLGSGNGKILLAATKVGAKAIGIEIHPILVWWSRFLSYLSKVPIKVIRASFWDINVSNADCIFIFGIKSKMPKLQQKIIQETRPGTKIVSNTFTFANWQYIQKNDSIYLYEVPDKTHI